MMQMETISNHVVRIKCVVFVYQSTKTKIKIKNLEHGRIGMKWDDHRVSRNESNFIKPRILSLAPNCCFQIDQHL
jgi:hypothetical protein